MGAGEREPVHESVAEARKALEFDETNYQARMMMALSHACQGNLALALEAAEAVYRTCGVRCVRDGAPGRNPVACWVRRIARSRSSRP